jgi:hypothetical protein
MDDRDLTQSGLAALVGKRLPKTPSQSAISRCITEDDKERIATLELIHAISHVLKIPIPVFVATNKLEALALQRAVLLHHEDLEAAATSAGVGDPTEFTQRGMLPTEHESSAPGGRRTRRRVERGRSSSS